MNRCVGHPAAGRALLAAGLSIGAACTPPGGPSPDENDNAAQGTNANTVMPALRNQRLRAVNDWAYQLQGRPVLALEPLAGTAFDLVVIDYSRDGSEDGAFTADEIAEFKNSSGGVKIVLAYLSIGEAEVGRFYFQNDWVTPDPQMDSDGPFTLTPRAPPFLTTPNPAFPDNFKVRFWQERWQQLILHNPGGHADIGDAPSYLDRIVDAGFDGVYLDIIDAFEFFGPCEIGGNDERRSAAADMIRFVAAIADYARTSRGVADFIVVPQNGSGVIASSAFPADALSVGESFDALRTRYLQTIDGIGAEDTFYFGDDDENNPLDPQDETIARLREFRAAGAAVLAIDYLTIGARIDDFYARVRAESWVPYCSVRALDQPTVNATQRPD